MTEKLYYVNQYLQDATARVLSCAAGKAGWLVTLDRTVFYPTGGGQPCDLGTIAGAAVTDVFEDGDTIVHVCDRPLPIGSEVELKLDWPRRFRLMQGHSGEHIVSGIIHARFGYDNVGFHMGSDAITIDFSGELNAEQLQAVELAANEAIWRDLPFRVFYPEAAALAVLPYRSKKELTGAVRLVEIEGVDLCACCGTHVARTGEIGLVKLLSNVRFHGGSRIEMLCGGEALAYLNGVCAQNQAVSAALSAKPLETAAAVRRLLDEQAALKYRLTGLENELLAARAAAVPADGWQLIIDEALSPELLRRYAELLAQKCSGAIFAGSGESYRYVLFDPKGDLRELSKRLNSSLNGRGGGKPGFVQGSVSASRAAIESFFSNENL